jgi:hypothetical protein
MRLKGNAFAILGLHAPDLSPQKDVALESVEAGDDGLIFRMLLIRSFRPSPLFRTAASNR